ncbi:MAG: hypothetical protein M0Z46_03650 [Actinomycetota bacterium]|jgi:hypothetical protein|nr:hypothetical protein [Actinomycetota bacterium]
MGGYFVIEKCGTSDGCSRRPQKGLNKVDPGSAAAERLTERLALDEPTERTGRPRTDPHMLREVARLVRDCVSRGEPYAAAVAEQFGVSENTARSWKRKAAERGYYKAPTEE